MGPRGVVPSRWVARSPDATRSLSPSRVFTVHEADDNARFVAKTPPRFETRTRVTTLPDVKSSEMYLCFSLANLAISRLRVRSMVTDARCNESRSHAFQYISFTVTAAVLPCSKFFKHIFSIHTRLYLSLFKISENIIHKNN